MCEDQTTLEYPWQVCDGREDCPGGEDEADCPAPFVCGDGSELLARRVCDGNLDCEDGTDERDCPETCGDRYAEANCAELSEAVILETSKCFPFQCYGDGPELPPEQRCDGTPDCPGGEDEDGCDPSGSDDPEGGESTGG